jgi:xanthine dehydrogenase large subunit
VAEWNARNDILKRGIALTPVKFGISFTLTHLNQAGALVHVYQDGSIHMNHGGTEMGQGLFQKVAQVAANGSAWGWRRVKITATDTGKVPNTSATAASFRVSDLNGMAVRAACDEIRGRIAEVVAPSCRRSPRRWCSRAAWCARAARRCPSRRRCRRPTWRASACRATGFYKTPKIEWDRIAGRGRPFFYFAYGVACSEVVIDTLTGENRILRTDILHDCGASLNPALDIGPDRGRLRAGRGLADDGGTGLGRPRRAQDPRALDLQDPGLFRPARHLQRGALGRANREDTIYRSKAVGEPPFMLGISVHSALSQACAACGPNFPICRRRRRPRRSSRRSA